MREGEEHHHSAAVYSGCFFLMVGIGTFVWSHNYTIGSATAMGPGFFPALIGALLAVVGLASILTGFLRGVSSWRVFTAREVESTLSIIGGVVAFGFLIDRAGLVAATFCAVFLSCIRRIISNPVEVFLIFAVLTAFCTLVFIYLFNMQIPLVRWPLQLG